jgi:hypothetical protein
MANSDNLSTVLDMREAQAAARTLGLDVVTSEIRRPEDIAPAFEALKGRVDALYVAAAARRRGDRVNRREFITRHPSLALFTDAKLDLGHKRARAKSA